jgi:rhamnosyl/mannosyltransferase
VKIVHAYKDFDPPVRGGMERHIALMCRYQREWAEVSALTCSRSVWSRHLYRDGTPVTEIAEFGRFQSAPFAPTYPWYLRAAHADVLVIHHPNPTAEVSVLLARPRSHIVVRYHSDVVRQAAAMVFYRPFLMRVLHRAEMIIPTSENYLNTSPYLGKFRDKCRVVPLGIIADDFEHPDESLVRHCHERYGETFVLFSGRHRYYKGLDYLVEAARAINVAVVIAGDGPETPRLKRLAAHENNVHFPGALSQRDLVAHLHACAVVAFPSIERSEAFGISILEAHACAKPVVATRLGTGVEYANLDGVTGINVPPRDGHALAEAINALLNEPGRAHAMGNRARKRVRKEFDARAVAEREFALYQEVAGCSKTGFLSSD